MHIRLGGLNSGSTVGKYAREGGGRKDCVNRKRVDTAREKGDGLYCVRGCGVVELRRCVLVRGGGLPEQLEGVVYRRVLDLRRISLFTQNTVDKTKVRADAAGHRQRHTTA